MNVIINHKGASIYWFFVPLFAIYLCIPVLSIIPVQNRKRLFGAMIAYSFITCSLLPTLCHVLGFEFNTALQNPLNGGGYIIYVLLGYYIVNYRIDKKTRICIYLSGILCAGFRIVYMISKYKETGCIDYTYSNYTNFLSVLMAVAVFVWFWYHDWSILKEKSFMKMIKLLSSLSFGVYLIHIYILRFVVVEFNISMQSFKWSILGVPLVYIVSLIFVWIGKQIPIVKRVIP